MNMAVSVRMDPLLEQELEAAAKRKGLTKSQFIIDAVERALGRKDPYRLLMKVQRAYGVSDKAAEAAAEKAAEMVDPASRSQRYRRDLREKHDADMRDWLAYHAAKKQGRTWSPGEDERGGGT
jgi:predicted DNA-binding protein